MHLPSANCGVMFQVKVIKTRAKLYSTIIGLVLALIAIYQLHNFMLVDACLDYGGKYEYETGVCIDGNTYEETIIVFSWVMLVLYAVLGFFVAGVSSYIFSKLLISIGGKCAET